MDSYKNSAVIFEITCPLIWCIESSFKQLQFKYVYTSKRKAYALYNSSVEIGTMCIDMNGNWFGIKSDLTRHGVNFWILKMDFPVRVYIKIEPNGNWFNRNDNLIWYWVNSSELVQKHLVQPLITFPSIWQYVSHRYWLSIMLQ